VGLSLFFTFTAIGHFLMADEMVCPRIVSTDLDVLFCKIWFPSPACGA
jgi:hypothetical protein